MKNLFPIFVIFLFLIFACNQQQDGNEATKKLRIAVIPKSTNNVFWVSVHAGAVKAARELDVEIDWQGPQKETDRQQQVSIVQNFISRRMDAIALAPLDSRSLIKVVNDAGQQNIPVIIYDSGLDADNYVSFVATDNYNGGRLCAEQLAFIVKGKKILMLRHMEGSASTTRREQGFLDALAEVMPDAELISTNQYGGVSVEKAFQVAQNLLNRFGEIDGIFCPSEPTTQGMLRALQLADKAQKIKFVGFDSNSDLVTGLEAGDIDGLALQDPFKMGYLAVKTAVQHVKGEKVEKRIDTGVYMITPENMKEEAMHLLLTPPVDKWLGGN